jgi:hypothetical protein
VNRDLLVNKVLLETRVKELLVSKDPLVRLDQPVNMVRLETKVKEFPVIQDPLVNKADLE